MNEKIAQLEALAGQISLRLKHAEEQNYTLKNRLRVLESQVGRLRDIEAEAKTLRDWKRDTTGVLKRLAAKIEKEIK